VTLPVTLVYIENQYPKARRFRTVAWNDALELRLQKDAPFQNCPDDPRHIIGLSKRIATVSLETAKAVKGRPEFRNFLTMPAALCSIP
jgi:hypothetical protein